MNLEPYNKAMEEGRRAVPAVRYAVGLVGVAAAFGAARLFFGGTGAALLGTGAMIALMALLWVFDEIVSGTDDHARFALKWSILSLFVFSIITLVLSVAVEWPRPWPAVACDIGVSPCARTSETEDRVDSRVRGFLGKENLPVPGTDYSDDQLEGSFSMTQSPVEALRSGTILPGPFPFYRRSIQGTDVNNESRAFLRDNTVAGIEVSQSCSMQMIELCRRSRREWTDFLRSTLTAGDTKTMDVGLPNGPGKPITPGTTETYTVLDDPWRAELIWAEPKGTLIDSVQVGVSVVMTIAHN